MILPLIFVYMIFLVYDRNHLVKKQKNHDFPWPDKMGWEKFLHFDFSLFFFNLKLNCILLEPNNVQNINSITLHLSVGADPKNKDRIFHLTWDEVPLVNWNFSFPLFVEGGTNINISVPDGGTVMQCACFLQEGQAGKLVDGKMEGVKHKKKLLKANRLKSELEIYLPAG